MDDYYFKIGSLIADIATAVAVVIAVFTILEMKKQRSESYKPMLVFRSNVFDYIGIKGERYILGRWVKPETDVQCRPFILIQNVGLGVAVDLEYKWEFNEEFLAESVRKLIVKLGYSASLEKVHDTYILDSGGGSLSASVIYDGKIPFALPISQYPESDVRLEIPGAFCLLLSNYVLFSLLVDRDYSKIKMPDCSVEFLVKDAGGAAIKFVKNLRMTINMVSHRLDGATYGVAFMLE